MLPLNQAVYAALVSALAPEPSAREPSCRIVQAYVNPAPLPPPEDQDILYFHPEPEGAVPLTERSTLAGGEPAFLRFSPYLLRLVFYGPRAEALAWQVYHRFYLDGRGNPRQILRASGIYPVPDPPAPVLIREEWKEHHRSRADLTIPLRMLSRDADAGPSAGIVETAPELALNT